MIKEKVCPTILSHKLSDSEINDFIVYSNNFEALQTFLKNKNIKHTPYPFIKAFYLKTNYDEIKALSKQEFVKYITSDSRVFAMLDKTREFICLKNLTQNKYFGKNITIAFIDTGISPHLDFLLPNNRIIKFVDLLNDKQEMYDDNGHGTFVTGVACGSGVCDHKKFVGIAPCANIVSIKALNENGETSANIILDAMQYVYDNKDKLNIKVVCMSFGAESMGNLDPLQKGAQTLWNSGIVVVAAAGNSGPGEKTIKSPGSNGQIITVGGLDDGRESGKLDIADFSSRGPTYNRYKPDLVAPAVNIISTTNFSQKKHFYAIMSGTSVSTPIVAGICAIILERFPQFTPDRVKYFLTRHCIPIVKDRNIEGFGYIKLDNITINY